MSAHPIPGRATCRAVSRAVATLACAAVAAVTTFLAVPDAHAAGDPPRRATGRGTPAKRSAGRGGTAAKGAARPGAKAAATAESRSGSRTGAKAGAKTGAKSGAKLAAGRKAGRAGTGRPAGKGRAAAPSRREVRLATRTAARTAGGAAARSVAPVAAWDDALAIRVPAFATPSFDGAAFAPAPSAAARTTGAAVAALDLDTLVGRSGKLRARFVVPSASGLFTYLRRLFGDSVEARPGVYTAAAGETRRPFTYIAMLPFAEKVDGRIGRYRIGFWPGERGGRARTAPGKYGPPAGFIQVTPDNAETAVSEHFRLRDFLTHDQARVWPKYLVLDPALVDKLELVISDLRARGYRADRLHVMSGFRTPQYNRGGGDTQGRAELSRHQYGDAADVWVENGDGTMADLNGDGRIDARDAAVLAEAAERVERAHPELTGGVGVYHGTRAHGPFVHIDTRGHRARWGAG